MRDVQTRFPKGKVIRSRYLVEELLGKGGFGAVYRVRDKRVGHNVFALKEVVEPTRRQRESLIFESEVLSRLDHPALPRVYRIIEDGKQNRLYMLMDYIEGPNLERLRQQQPGKRFSLSRVMRMLTPVVEAVSYLHAQQPPIIHRDIKPANIIVTSAGNSSVLVDFGIAKEYDEDSTTTAVRHCSPGYGAPEQYAGGTNAQTDIYGLGATFYTLLTGEVPIDALFRLTRMSSKGVDPLEPVNVRIPSLSVEVAQVIQRAMALNCSERFTTIEEFWDALQLARSGEDEPLEAAMGQVPQTDQAAEQPQLISVTPLPDPDTLSEAPVTPSLFSEATTRNASHFPLFATKISKRGVFIFALFLLVIAVIGTSITFGARLEGAITHIGIQKPMASSVASRKAPAAKAPATTPVATAAITVTPVAPTATPTPAASDGAQSGTPTPLVPVASSYPELVASYSGSIHNTPAAVDSTLSLSQVKRNGATISGYLTVGPGLLGSGHFTGTVTTEGRIHLLMPDMGSFLPLSFSGQIQPDGSMSGTYCSYQNSQCNYAGGGYGNWHVAAS